LKTAILAAHHCRLCCFWLRSPAPLCFAGHCCVMCCSAGSSNKHSTCPQPNPGANTAPPASCCCCSDPMAPLGPLCTV
uniref:Secreted protein n=1 Tax=Meleagris gallopavo TaxID=9103 RepID=A0A803YIE8_MELGA